MKHQARLIIAGAVLAFVAATLFSFAQTFVAIGLQQQDRASHNALHSLAAQRAVDVADAYAAADLNDDAARRDIAFALDELSSMIRDVERRGFGDTTPLSLLHRFFFSGFFHADQPHAQLERQFLALSHLAELLADSAELGSINAPDTVAQLRRLASEEIMRSFEADTLWHGQMAERAFRFAGLTQLVATPVLIATMILLWSFLIAPERRREARRMARLEAALTTARDDARAALDASEAKSRFLGTMSHEIRTPMNGVIGLAEVLRSSLKDPELRSIAATLKDSGLDLLRILNDILDFTKIEAGRMELIEAPFSPEALAAKMRALHGAEAAERDIAFRARCVGEPSLARMGDELRITQILNNLIGNAIKFTEGGSVDVDIVNDRSGDLVLTVRDTGVGMTPEQAQRAVMEFTQADDHSARRLAGTGLGLSIVKRLAEQMGGELDLRAALDVGVTATVSLPLPVAPAAVVPAPKPMLVAAGD